MDGQQVLAALSDVLEPIFGTFDVRLVMRMLLVTLLCGLVGFERSGHERASGFRQHILVGIGACLMTMAGGYGFPEIASPRDPMRAASYVISGIGFLGAGAILRHGTTVTGMTTAASIWCAAGLGVAVGVGMGVLAAVATLLILFTLITLQRLEEAYQARGATNSFDVHLLNDDRAVGKTLGALARLGVPIKRATVQPGEGESGVLHVDLMQPMKQQDIKRMAENLLTLKVVERVDTASIKAVSMTDKEGKSQAVFEHPKSIAKSDDEMEVS